MNAITIAHLSDIHHNPDENSQISTLLREKGLLVEKLLGQCLETLKQRKPDIVLITGDMTHEGTSSHYRYLRDALSSALPGTPVLCAMGNHDVRGAFREGFLGLAPSDRPYYASASVKRAVCAQLPCTAETALIQSLSTLMDSAFEKGLEGVLTKEAMDFLENAMEAAGKSGPGSSAGPETILLMHHPILKAAGPMGLTADSRLLRLLESGRIAAMFNGHVHGSYTGTVCGVPQFTADSLKTGCDYCGHFLAYNDRAGYQLVTFQENGDWNVERFLLHPEIETFFQKNLYT